jgi:hypothetical protein
MSMQGMKADAATIGVENRVGQEVVQVDENGAGHDESSCPPMFAPEEVGYGKWNDKMIGVMDYVSQDT